MLLLDWFVSGSWKFFLYFFIGRGLENVCEYVFKIGVICVLRGLRLCLGLF